MHGQLLGSARLRLLVRNSGHSPLVPLIAERGDTRGHTRLFSLVFRSHMVDDTSLRGDPVIDIRRPSRTEDDRMSRPAWNVRTPGTMIPARDRCSVPTCKRMASME